MLAYLYRRARLKGLFGGSRPWTLLWAAMFGGRLIRKLTGQREDVQYRTVLHPGESLIITHERDARVIGAAEE